MKRFASSWLSLLLLLLGSGCASRVPPASLEATTKAIQASSRAESPELTLPEPVAENQTFVTLEGIPRYKIGPGDVLEVFLTKGFSQEKHTVGVKPNGSVTVAFFDATVMGLTAEQAAEEIHQILSSFYKELSVDVIVKEHNSKKVAVFGAVRGNTGIFPLKGRTTIFELLAEAGGPAPKANLEKVRLIRPGRVSYTLNLRRFLSNGDTVRDIVLDTRDVVYVPSVEDKKVFAMGEVAKPGAFPLIPNMRLSQLVAQAGGAKDTAILESARIIRGNLESPQILAVDFQGLMEQGDVTQDLRLEANDLVFFPRNAIGNWNAFMAQIKPTLQILSLLMDPAVDALLIKNLVEED